MPKLNTTTALAAYHTSLADRREDAPPRAATTDDVERGTVKWYDPGRGIGFIDTARGEVFLGGRVVEGAGIDPWPGDLIEFEREPPLRGSTDVAIRPRIVAVSPRQQGTVKFYGMGHKEHGYIRADRDGASIFVNRPMLDANGIATLSIGDRVEFYRAGGDPRPFAQRLRVIE